MTDRDTVVVEGGGSSTGILLGIVALVLVLAAAWYFVLGPGAGSNAGTDEGPTINVELPSVPPAE